MLVILTIGLFQVDASTFSCQLTCNNSDINRIWIPTVTIYEFRGTQNGWLFGWPLYVYSFFQIANRTIAFGHLRSISSFTGWQNFHFWNLREDFRNIFYLRYHFVAEIFDSEPSNWQIKAQLLSDQKYCGPFWYLFKHVFSLSW